MQDQKMRNTQKGKRGLGRLKNAFLHSLEGIKSAYKDEEAFRQIAIVAFLCIGVGSFVARSWVEWCLLILPCFLALIAELANSALENAVDFTSLEIHPLAKKAKDMGSAIQFFACVLWILVWGGYGVERLWGWF